MKVAKSVNLELDDLIKIREIILKGKIDNVSEFVRLAVNKELKRW